MNPHYRPYLRTLRMVGLFALVLLYAPALPAGAQSFTPINLVTNNQAIHPGVIADPNLVDAWGVSFSPTGSPFWVSDAGAGVSTLYSVDPKTNAPTTLGLVVTIPGTGAQGVPTGQVFNGNNGTAFNSDTFLFVGLDGTVSGWRGSLGTTAERLVLGSTSNSYTGATIGTLSGNTYLYAANFKSGAIDVIKGSSAQPDLAGNFQDPNLPSGFAPFNIQKLGDTLYVAYAKQSSTSPVGTPGVGNGFVDAYNLDGTLQGRIATQGTLDSPWGLAIAPSSFGTFAGDLLVGNFGNGRINAYDLSSNSFVSQLNELNGSPVDIDGLWTLTIGNDGRGGSADKLYFTAGPERGANGLFGILQPVPEPGSTALLAATILSGTGLLLRRRRK
jgi:uncharacterized protein (TIGR03118 family)